MMNKRKPTTHKPQFDLKVDIRDGKGNVVRSDPYRLTIINGIKEFERPPGSGYFYTEGGQLLREPKGSDSKSQATSKQDFSNDELKRQIKALQDQLNKKEIAVESEEIHMTAKDVDVSDVPAIPASEVDNSEEIALMVKAGAFKEAEEIKATKYNKQTFIK